MTPFDKLNQHAILIRQFEFRTNKDDLNYLISISKDVISAFSECEGVSDRVEVIANKLMSILPFAGVTKKEIKTLDIFDEYKCFLLNEIKAAKLVLMGGEEVEVEV